MHRKDESEKEPGGVYCLAKRIECDGTYDFCQIIIIRREQKPI